MISIILLTKVEFFLRRHRTVTVLIQVNSSLQIFISEQYRDITRYIWHHIQKNMKTKNRKCIGLYWLPIIIPVDVSPIPYEELEARARIGMDKFRC